MLDVEALKSGVTLSSVITEFSGGDLKPAGNGRWKTLCTFHSEKTPSMSVNDVDGFFHCFGCGQGGDAVAFVSELLSIDFVDAVAAIAEKFSIDVGKPGTTDLTPDSILREAIYRANAAAEEAYAAALLDKEEHDVSAAYAMMRDKHLTYTVASTYGIGYAPGARWLYTRLKKTFDDDTLLAAGLISRTNFGLRDAFHNRLIFTLRDQRGRVVGFNARKLNEDDKGGKYINTAKTLVYNKSAHLYGLDRAKSSIRSTGTVIIVEGATDVLAYAHAGVPNCVAACGTAFGSGHLTTLRSLVGSTHPLTAIYVGDGDPAGLNATTRFWNTTRNTPNVTVKGYMLPPDTDPNDLWISTGNDVLPTTSDAAQPMAQVLIDRELEAFTSPDSSPEELSAATRNALAVIDGWTDAVAASSYRTRIAHTSGIRDDELPSPVAAATPKQPPAPSSRDDLAREALRMMAQHPDCAFIIAAAPASAFRTQRDKDLHHYLHTLRTEHPDSPLHESLNAAPESPQRTEGFRLLMEQPALSETVAALDYAGSLALMLEDRAHTSTAAKHLQAVRQAHTPTEQRAALQRMLSSREEHRR